MIDRLFDLVFPPRCPACDDDARAPLCARCAESLYPLDIACPRCAEPLESPTPHLCRRCRHRPPPLESIRAPYRYGGELATAIARLKYGRRPDIARTLAPLLAPAVRDALASADVLVPVPLHWRRHASRGFNQAAVLLEEACAGTRAPIDDLSLIRVRPTASQTSLDRRARAANLAGAFRVSPRRAARVRGRAVVLFDDVVTTGATLSAAARALRAAGAACVRGVCLARAEEAS